VGLLNPRSSTDHSSKRSSFGWQTLRENGSLDLGLKGPILVSAATHPARRNLARSRIGGNLRDL
jgi:hypothetical protein